MGSQRCFFTVPTIIFILSILASCHMRMKTPVPYGRSTLNNSPLAGDGSDFPCKLRSHGYDLQGASNVMAIGEPQTLSFLGSAVHGGGSCQVSLTTDLQPSRSSKWMVIKSIEGGCPAAVPGNLPDDPNGSGAATFTYTIPQGITPGEYTIAWSWLNKIGNREFYMNCGPATVTNAKKKRYVPSIFTRQASLPEIFVANLAGINDCTSPEGFDYIYPDPGDNVQSAAANPNTYTRLLCKGIANGYVASSTTVATTGGSTDLSTIYSTTSTSSAYDFTTSTAVTVPPEATNQALSNPSSAVSPSGNSSSISGTPCSNEGEWACSADGKSFQRCSSGVWSVSIFLSEGTRCAPGTSNTINITASKVKRLEG